MCIMQACHPHTITHVPYRLNRMFPDDTVCLNVISTNPREDLQFKCHTFNYIFEGKNVILSLTRANVTPFRQLSCKTP